MKLIFKKILVIVLLSGVLSLVLTPLVINLFNINVLGQPTLKQYRSDEYSFLETFYLMKQGQDYYHAYYTARQNFSDGVHIDNQLHTFRLPTIFYIWSWIAQDGRGILTLFMFLSILVFTGSFLYLEKYSGRKSALVGVVLFLFYLFDSLSNKSSFLFIEWWGLYFFLLGIFCLVFRLNALSIALLSLSVFTRELFIIPIFFLFLFSLYTKQHRRLFLAVILLSIGFYYLNYFLLTHFLNNLLVTSNLSRFHTYAISDLQNMVSFSMRRLVFFNFKTHYLLIGLGLVGAVRTIVSKNFYSSILGISALSFLVILPLISFRLEDYWGIVFVPLLLLLVPMSLSIKNIR